MENVVNYVHLISTVAMVGIIWFVQISHYPLLAFVPSDSFSTYERQHVYRVTFVVGPLMLMEVFSSAYLLLAHSEKVFVWVPFVLLIFIWLSTLFLQVPCHRILENGKDDGAIQKLVRTNWIRTVFWTARGFFAVYLFSVINI